MSEPGPLDPSELTVELSNLTLAGEAAGEGPPIFLAHGLTATRRYVVHGSRTLPRSGFRTVAYDARGHGESGAAPAGTGYSYAELADDLAAAIEAHGGGRPVVLAGHSMGAHTLTALALRGADAIAAIVLIGPTHTGEPLPPEALAYWDRLADGLERGGTEGFLEAYDEDLDPRWRETLLRITRDRLSRHPHPKGVAQALREVPRSSPFESLDQLEALEVPALVVASHDDSDPGHPYAVAAAWSERLPQGRLISEARGESPLAWQGGKLSRAIASFCGEDAVRARLTG